MSASRGAATAAAAAAANCRLFLATPRAHVQLQHAGLPVTGRYHGLRLYTADAVSPSENENGDESASTVAVDRVVCFGGNGFVGSAVCREALSRGWAVRGCSRSGAPNLTDDWVGQVEWRPVNLLSDQSRDATASALEGAKAAISTVGAFGSYEQQYASCGKATIAAAEAAASAGVERFVFVSVTEANPGFLRSPLRGYFEGKRDAEQAITELFPDGRGVIVRPGFVYGSRKVYLPPSGQPATIPLGLVGRPLAAVLGALSPVVGPLRTVPVLGMATAMPVSVEAVAKACLDGAQGVAHAPIMDVDVIARYDG